MRKCRKTRFDAAEIRLTVHLKDFAVVLLSVIVPVFNEEATIEQLIKRIRCRGPAGCELIVVDDGSTDSSPQILARLSHQHADIRFAFKGRNEGKTAAVLAGLDHASGRWILVQDADLEYDPADIRLLINQVTEETQVVYGRRPSCWQMPTRWVFAGGVLFIDVLILCVYRRWVRDHASCYKLIRRECLGQLDLQSTGFEGCVEITAKLMRSDVPIAQVPISYAPRSIAEGKKLTIAYGWTAIKNVLRWMLWSPSCSRSAGAKNRHELNEPLHPNSRNCEVIVDHPSASRELA